MISNFKDIPLGLSMALAQNAKAMQTFAAMSEKERAAFLERVRTAQSKSQMQQFTNELAARNTAQ